MKKIVGLFIVALLPLGVFAQSEFDKYIDSDDVTSVIINKGLLKMFSKIAEGSDDKEAKDLASLADNIKGIRVFVTEKATATADMEKTVKSYLKKSKMEMLMQVKEKDTRVKFYVKSSNNDNIVHELLMFVRGIDHEKTNYETVLVSMTGKIELDKLGAMVDTMDLPKELEKAEKGR